MKKSEKRNQKIKSVLVISIIGILAGFLFTVRAFGFDRVHIIKGIVGGFMIMFLIGIFENFIFLNKFRKMKFSLILFIRTFTYIVIISFGIISVWVVHESIANDAGILTTLGSSDFRKYITEGDFKRILFIATAFSFLLNLFKEINNLLGKNVLMHYITGKYHHPQEEERVFMFVDLSSSTTIAEKLGPVVYHKFINSYFFNIDDAIVESKGEVYQYVGDEVVISWKGSAGYADANCVRCFFNIREKIDSLAEDYEKEYGIVPGFKAGLHCGSVITGEVGDSKKEIVFHGDVMNTASRIQGQCNALGFKFLVSEDVLGKINLPEEYKSEHLGSFKLRGKAMEVKLYSVQKK